MIMIVKDFEFETHDGKVIPMELYLNIASIKNIEKELKSINGKLNFYNAIPLIQQGEATIAIIYICSCLHKPNNFRCVDSEFFDKNNIDYLRYSNELVIALIECLQDTKATKEGKNNGVGK